jgi:hypothetical protein
MTGFARTALGVALGCTAVLGFGAGTANATPYSNTAAQALSTETPQPGDTVTDVLTGFAPNEVITGLFFSSPQHIFTVTTDGTGAATATFQVPDHACGGHTVVAQGAGGERVATPITVGGDCPHRNHHDGSVRPRHNADCADWRDPGFWVHNCDSEGGDDGFEDGWYDDTAYTGSLPAQHSNTSLAGIVGLGMLAPALLGGGMLIARRRGR